MKKVFVLFCVSIYLLSTTEFCQLLKIPVLVEHYIEHKEENTEMSILDFLTLHYQGNHQENHPYDYDYQQDQKLPFIAQADVLSVFFVFSPFITFDIKDKILLNQSLDVTSYKNLFIENRFLSSIWQPPRLV